MWEAFERLENVVIEMRLRQAVHERSIRGSGRCVELGTIPRGCCGRWMEATEFVYDVVIYKGKSCFAA